MADEPYFLEQQRVHKRAQRRLQEAEQRGADERVLAMYRFAVAATTPVADW